MSGLATFEVFLKDLRPFLYRKSITYVDVGAYVGKTFLSLMDSGIRVREAHLVEPNPISREQLEKNIVDIDSCNILEVHPIALGNEASEIELHVAKGMTKVVSGDLSYRDLGVKTVKAKCLTLDELSRVFNIPHISLLKLDVEGFEVAVLQGASSLLSSQKIDVLYLEVGFNPEGTQQTYYRKIEDLLNSYGYKIFKIYEQTHELHTDSPVLRRANVAFFSESFSKDSPYKLSLELFESKKKIKQLSSIKENLNEKVLLLSKEKEELNEQISLFLKKDEKKNKEIEKLHVEIEELLIKTECLDQRVKKLSNKVFVTQNKLNLSVRKLKSLKDGMRYRLGSIIALSLSSPIEWLKTPFRVVKLAYQYKEKQALEKKRNDAEDTSQLIEPIDISKDVLIITNLRFPGGNASSTVDEIRVFLNQGLSVGLINCPVVLGQKKLVSDRYSQYKDLVTDIRNIKSLKAKLVIVRHPRVVSSSLFIDMASRIEAEKVVFVINNSMFRPTGEPVYSVSQFLKGYDLVSSDDKSIFPLGPAIRSELHQEKAFNDELLSSFDWSPTFDSSRFTFSPHEIVELPIVIGRHGRDGPEKWIEDPSALASIYPESDSFVIKILGGADNAFEILERTPQNWEVLPFGSIDPAEYLKQLDVFVYFPNSNLNEAFGRTIMEAIFSGVPCVLPYRFSETFGDLAFYCDPFEVEAVVKRLSEQNESKVKYLEYCRNKAFSLFDSSVLVKRSRLDKKSEEIMKLEEESLTRELIDYKHWVEKGCADNKTVFQ